MKFSVLFVLALSSNLAFSMAVVKPKEAPSADDTSEESSVSNQGNRGSEEGRTLRNSARLDVNDTRAELGSRREEAKKEYQAAREAANLLEAAEKEAALKAALEAYDEKIAAIDAELKAANEIVQAIASNSDEAKAMVSVNQANRELEQNSRKNEIAIKEALAPVEQSEQVVVAEESSAPAVAEPAAAAPSAPAPTRRGGGSRVSAQ